MGVATVLVRGAKTDPHGWALVVEAEQGLEEVAEDGVVVPYGKLFRGYPVSTRVEVPREM